MAFPVAPINNQQHTNAQGTTWQWSVALNRWLKIFAPIPGTPSGVGNLENTLVTDDAPGTGSNTLLSGKSRIWRKATGAQQIYLLTNESGTYGAVELSTV